MALYNGQDTKEKILISARYLFYEKGYEQTTFKDIASHAKINQGSIYYHFKTKSNLGKTIYQEIAKENLQIAEKYFLQSTNELVCFLIGSYIYWNYFFNDEGYRKFNIAAMVENFNFSVDDYQDIFICTITDFIDQKLLKNKQRFFLTVSGSVGYTKSLGISAAAKLGELTVDEVWEFDAEKLFIFFEMDKSHMNETVKQARSCFYRLDLKNRGFHVTAELKKD